MLKMQEFLLWLNSAFCLLAMFINAKQLRRSNPRYMLRIVAFAISAYMFCVYFFAAVGLLSSADIALWMRWFIVVIMAYFISEAQNG